VILLGAPLRWAAGWQRQQGEASKHSKQARVDAFSHRRKQAGSWTNKVTSPLEERSYTNSTTYFVPCHVKSAVPYKRQREERRVAIVSWPPSLWSLCRAAASAPARAKAGFPASQGCLHTSHLSASLTAATCRASSHLPLGCPFGASHITHWYHGTYLRTKQRQRKDPWRRGSIDYFGA
jgi:hypothetical protein